MSTKSSAFYASGRCLRCLPHPPAVLREPQSALHFANEQPRAVHWQTSRRPGRRARYATVNRRLLGATKKAATLYSVRAGWEGPPCQPGPKKPRARRRTDAPPARGSHRTASYPSDESAAAPAPKKRRSAHGADSIITQRRAAATSNTIDAALRSRRPPSERRFRTGRLARLRELR